MGITMDQEKISLTWHTYLDHLRDMMKELMKDDITDVTLVSEDRKHIKAHKNIDMLSQNMKVQSMLVISVTTKLQDKIILKHTLRQDMKASSLPVISVSANLHVKAAL